jgi:hypothetical protein
MGSNILDTATQEAGFYGKLADLGTNVLSGLESETERAARLQREALQKQKDDAEITRINAETAYLTAAQRGTATQAQKDALDKATQASSIIQKNTQTITQSPKQAPADGTKTPNLVMQQQPTTAAPAAKAPATPAAPQATVKPAVPNPMNTAVKQAATGLKTATSNTQQTAAQKFNNQNQQAKFR